MKSCYFLWALSVTCGILFFNFILLKNYNINFTYILFFAFFLIVSLPATLLIRKIYLNEKRVRIFFLLITISILFISGFLSSGFYYENINEFSLLAEENNIFKNNSIQVISTGRINSPPFKKFNNIYFEFKIAELEILNKETNKYAQLNDCGTIFIKHKIKDRNYFYLDDYVKLDISKLETYRGNDGSISNIFTALKIINIKEQGASNYFYNLKSRIHGCLSYLFFESLDGNNAKMACALILGNQANMPMEIIESFKKSGIYHLLAISGLHISIIALFIFKILRKICHPLKSAKIIISSTIVLFLIFYNFMVGEKASMLRASVMFCLVFFSRDLFKDYKQENVLLISYTILILANPNFLTNIGFILSFASVAALIYIVPLVKNCLFCFQNSKNAANNYFVKSIIAAFSINIFILPILSYYYGGFSLISILTNLASAPVFYILLLDLFISSVAAVVWFPSGSCLIMPANFLMNIIIRLSEFFNSLPYAFIKTEIFKNKTLIYLYYSLLIIVLVSISLFLKKRRKE